MARELDHTGIPSKELRSIFDRFIDVDLIVFASRVGMNPRDVKKYVREDPEEEFVPLHSADRILLGLDLNITDLIHTGELTIIPAEGDDAARQMAEDEYWIKGWEVTPQTLEKRIEQLQRRRAHALG